MSLSMSPSMTTSMIPSIHDPTQSITDYVSRFVTILTVLCIYFTGDTGQGEGELQHGHVDQAVRQGGHELLHSPGEHDHEIVVNI